MAARRRRPLSEPTLFDAPHVRPDADWQRSSVWTVNGREIERGSAVTVRGERGAKFRMIEHVRRPDGREWLTVVGGTTGVTMFRSFRPERVIPPKVRTRARRAA